MPGFTAWVLTVNSVLRHHYCASLLALVFSKERCTDPVKLSETALRHFQQESPRTPLSPTPTSTLTDCSWNWDDSLRSDKNWSGVFGISLRRILAFLPWMTVELYLNAGLGIGLHCFRWGGFWSRSQNQMFFSFSQKLRLNSFPVWNKKKVCTLAGGVCTCVTVGVVENLKIYPCTSAVCYY